jgi:hypothetical protein
MYKELKECFVQGYEGNPLYDELNSIKKRFYEEGIFYINSKLRKSLMRILDIETPFNLVKKKSLKQPSIVTSKPKNNTVTIRRPPLSLTRSTKMRKLVA